MILPLPLLWYVSDLLLERLEKQRVTLIIRPGNSELEAEVVGSGFPAICQALSSAGPSFVATPLLSQPLFKGFVSMPW